MQVFIIMPYLLLIAAVGYVFYLKRCPESKTPVNAEQAPPISNESPCADEKEKYKDFELPDKGIKGKRGEWFRPVSMWSEKGVYTGHDLVPNWVNSVYYLDLGWVNSVATTSAKHFKEKDLDKATIVVVCTRVDIRKDKFRLYIIEPHGEYWTEFVSFDLKGSNDKCLADNMDLYSDRTMIIDGYVSAGKFYVKDIQPMKIKRYLLDW